MNYTIIDAPPSNVGDYVGIPESDTDADYVDKLVTLLKQLAFDVKAEDFTLTMIEQADQKWPTSGHYRILMEPGLVNPMNPKRSTHSGNFYFERLK